MNKKIEMIIYGFVGVASATMFVFSALFPKYVFSRECVNSNKEYQLTQEEIAQIRESLWNNELQIFMDHKLTQEENINDSQGNVKVTCLTYECFKEIVNGSD